MKNRKSSPRKTHKLSGDALNYDDNALTGSAQFIGQPPDAILLSDSLRWAKGRGWAVTPIREAVVAGIIPSWRSSAKKRARYFVRWSEIEAFIRSLGE